MADKLPTDGSFGAPPPDAPLEITHPLRPSTVEHHLVSALRNERHLRPPSFDDPANGRAVVEMLEWFFDAKRRGVLP